MFYVIKTEKETGDFMLVGTPHGATLNFNPKQDVTVLASAIDLAEKICRLSRYDIEIIHTLLDMLDSPIPYAGDESADAFTMSLQSTAATLLVVNRQLLSQLAEATGQLEATRKQLDRERELIEKGGLDALLRLSMQRL